MPTTPNMNLVLPTVSSTLGPDWATLLNAALSLVDSHDHSSGEGVKITPAGMNISTNLSFNDFYATDVGSLRLTSLGANLATPSDIGCFYNVNGNLWWNNDAGAQVQITSGGSVIAASDGIARAFSRTAVASNTIISAAATTSYYDVDTTTGVTFTLPAANAVTAGRFYEFKDTTGNASANNITINRAGADTIDGATSVVVDVNYAGRRLISDGTSKWASSYIFPNKVQTAVIQDAAVTTAKIADSNVTTAKIADGSVTQAKRAALGQQISASSGFFSTTSGSFVDATNLSVTITTTGRLVFVGLIPDGAVSDSYIGIDRTTAATAVSGRYNILRDSTSIMQTGIRLEGASGNLEVYFPPGNLYTIDVVAAGTYTYKVQAQVVIGSPNVVCNNVKLIAYEL